jgi:hypothetical protein
MYVDEEGRDVGQNSKWRHQTCRGDCHLTLVYLYSPGSRKGIDIFAAGRGAFAS